MDELRKSLLEIRSNAARVKRQLGAADKEINRLKKQYAVIGRKKTIAHLRLQALLTEQQSD